MVTKNERRLILAKSAALLARLDEDPIACPAPGCTETFYPTRPGHIYCLGSACRTAAWREREFGVTRVSKRHTDGESLNGRSASGKQYRPGGGPKPMEPWQRNRPAGEKMGKGFTPFPQDNNTDNDDDPQENTPVSWEELSHKPSGWGSNQGSQVLQGIENMLNRSRRR